MIREVYTSAAARPSALDMLARKGIVLLGNMEES